MPYDETDRTLVRDHSKATLSLATDTDDAARAELKALEAKIILTRRMLVADTKRASYLRKLLKG